MTNEAMVFERFYKQYPEYRRNEHDLKLNLYGDILDTKNNNRIIATADTPHSLSSIGYAVPEKWTIAK